LKGENQLPKIISSVRFKGRVDEVAEIKSAA